MRSAPGFLGIIWRALVIAAGYVLSLIAFGVIASVAGVEIAAAPGSESILVRMFISGLLLAMFIGPLASRMSTSRSRQTAVWFSVIFFNMGSVAIEGAYFAPELITLPLPVLFIQQLLASLAVAVLTAMLFSRAIKSESLADSIRLRPWYSWAWRFTASCLTYLFAYFVFGALNYNLATQPYYAAHAGGLSVPPAEVVLIVEAVRAPLIILSTGFFVLSFRTTGRRLALTTGVLLFWVGGLAPLTLQVNTLPVPLLAASAIEIFFQNVLTGVAAALLLKPPGSDV